jgi:hypothetical protein
MKDHRLIDERSLAFDRLTAAKIAADPALIERARGTLRRWLTTASPRVRPVLLEWEALLKAPLEELLATLTGTDERAVRLRQSSPFAGILSAAERTAILQEYQRRESSAA